MRIKTVLAHGETTFDSQVNEALAELETKLVHIIDVRFQAIPRENNHGSHPLSHAAYILYEEKK